MDAARLRAIKDELFEALGPDDTHDAAPSAISAAAATAGLPASFMPRAAPPPRLSRQRSASLERGASSRSLLSIAESSRGRGDAPPSPRRVADMDHVERMHRQAEVNEAKRVAAKARAEEEAVLAAQPALNRKSLSIAEALTPDKWEKLHSRSLSMRRLLPDVATPADGSPPGDAPNVNAARPSQHSTSSPAPQDRDGYAEATFHPALRRKSIALAAKRNPPNVPVTERLYRDATAAVERRQAVARKVSAEALRECTFYPDLQQAASAALPQGKGAMPTSRRDVGASPALNGSARTEGADGGKTPFYVHVYHAPQTAARGKAVSNGGGVVHHRRTVSPTASAEMYARHLAWVQERDRRLEQARLEAQRAEVAACTFAPMTNSESSTPVASPSQPSKPRQYTPTGAQWMYGADGSMHVSPAQPQPHRNRARSVSPHASRGRMAAPAAAAGPRTNRSSSVSRAAHYRTEGPPPGVNGHLARQVRARELAHEKRNPPFVDGSRWTGRATQPQEFTLRLAGNGRRASIGTDGDSYASRALRKPVSAATSGISMKGSPTRGPAPESAISPDASTPAMASPQLQYSSHTSALAGSDPLLTSGGMTTADDIRARLRQLEAMTGTPTPASASRTTFSHAFAPGAMHDSTTSTLLHHASEATNSVMNALMASRRSAATTSSHLMPSAMPPAPPGIAPAPSRASSNAFDSYFNSTATGPLVSAASSMSRNSAYTAPLTTSHAAPVRAPTFAMKAFAAQIAKDPLLARLDAMAAAASGKRSV